MLAVPVLTAGMLAGLSTLPGPALAADAALAAADPQRVTAKLIKTCAKCHLEEGVSDDPEVPHLAGQPATYLYKQLQDYAADRREGGRMNKTARKLSDQEMADLSVLFASKSLPTQAGVSPLPAPAQVTSVDDNGCAGCHGEDGRGKHDKYDAPALAGMPIPYFKMAMASFRDGERQNDADGAMRKAAKGLSDADIEGLAAYYLALGQRAPMAY
jgi:cytochrome c553